MRLYRNKLTDLGKQICQGLKFMRKKLNVMYEEPDYLSKKPEELGFSVSMIDPCQAGDISDIKMWI